MVSKSTRMKQTLILTTSVNEFYFQLYSFDHNESLSCLYWTPAGNVTIEIGELSDGPENEEENKSGGPGWCFSSRK